MNPEPEFVTTEAVGQALGELLGAFVTTINAMRRQPGFDDSLFTAELQEILKKRTRDANDFQLRIVVHPTVLTRLRSEDEKHFIEMEKCYFGKLSFRDDPGMHAEQFKILNVETNEELASVA